MIVPATWLSDCSGEARLPHTRQAIDRPLRFTTGTLKTFLCYKSKHPRFIQVKTSMKQSSRPIPKPHAAPITLLDLLRSRADQYPYRLAYRFIQSGETEMIFITDGELDRRARTSGACWEISGAAGERGLLLYDIASLHCNDYKS